jgi:hypothetical protein
MLQVKYPHIHIFTLVVIWLGLFLDGSEQAHQLYTNILVLVSFSWVYYFASKSVKQLMLFGLIIGLSGELLFALVFGMYTYRLENLPLYVPFGHSLIYASVYYIVKEPLVKKYQEQIINILYISMILYSTLWLLFANDTLGFICMLLVLALFKRYPKTKLFFLFMFFVVVYLELIGTYYGCWHWPEIWFDKVAFISSANPPSGISVFYFGFDIGCLWFYKHYDRNRWVRMKKLSKKREIQRISSPQQVGGKK